MPTQSRGFFTCDFCGLACDSLHEAQQHENHCSQRPPPQRPQPTPEGSYQRPPGGPPAYGTMGPLSGYSGQKPPYYMGYGYGPPHAEADAPKPRCVPLMGANENTGVSPDDVVACQNLEIFEATPEHVAEHDASRSGGIPVTLRQVGLRCCHCPKTVMPASSYGTVFPASLGTIASSVRTVADHHLSSCSMAPPQVREACQRVANTRRESEQDPTPALLDHCIGLCHHLGIVNKRPHKSGIAFVDVAEESGHPPSHTMETPAAHRGPPYLNERGPPMSHDRMGYPTPGPPGRPGPPMMGGPMGPGDSIAPTPLQRRRDRPGEGGERPPIFSADREGGAPTPYSQGPPGGDSYGAEAAGIQTPAQPNFDSKEGGAYPTPHSAPPAGEASPPSAQPHDLPGNFPFYPDSRFGVWLCKFCSHVPEQYRDPQFQWSSPYGNPPPGKFIDDHLGMCRAYHQTMSPPPMYQGPPYGPPFIPGQQFSPYGPPPGAWDGHSPTHAAGMIPPGFGYPPGSHPEAYSPYPPPHSDARYRPEEGVYGDQRGRPGPPMGPHGLPGSHPSAMVPHGPPGMPGMAGRGPGGQPPHRKENMADVMRVSMSHLVTRDNEYYARDPDAAKMGRLVLDEDKLLLTDYFFFLMKQLRICRFSESDRKTRGGKREKIKLGYGGLQCIHCSDVPNSRKFFWSNVDRLANSFAEIPGHVLKCRCCPQQTRDALLSLKQFHSEQMSRLPRGSQKVFFRRMWRRLHDEDPKNPPEDDKSNTENVAPAKKDNPNGVVDSGSGESKTAPDSSLGGAASDESVTLLQRSTKEAAKALAESSTQTGPHSPTNKVLLAIAEDKEWLSDMDCFIRKQLEVFCANEDDVAVAQSDRKYPVHVGQVGIRCIHCSLSKSGQEATGTAVAFPFAISGIYESVREFQRLHLDSCENLPAATKSKLAGFKGSSSLSSVLRKYYVLAAKALGLQDTREGIQSGAESLPLGSQAAFSFADGPNAAIELRRKVVAAEETSAAATVSKSSPSSTPSPEDSKKRSDPDSKPDDDEPPTKVARLEDSVDVGDSAEV